ncbi:FAD dependent oxidoreductase [uncultured Eubacteriales bacterium]|uniref:FAD dependent oxidoreductase n=1 Tax=uncultured Eubacteriales bacterium TaxID=172733 RepID=A0A212KFW7_9FIRM|nr:FAD dependent oxidoreductase [uncultured Eubacteriales bacterium]
MNSIWRTTTEIESRPALEGDVEAETAVLGGGLAGVLTAYFLQERGVETVLLEANRLGSGQTGNTTAKVTSQHGLLYQKLIRELGEEGAGQYARANQRAVAAFRTLVEEKNIDCQWEERPACLYSTAGGELLQEEAHAAWRLGIDAKFTTDTELPFPVKGAVRFAGQAQFHPLKFLEHIARDLTVYEGTRAIKVEGDTVVTDKGKVKAKHIVFATHFPFVNMPGYYFLRLHQERSYVLALENAQPLDGMYLGVDEGGLSLRTSGELLLLGGGGHRTGENSAGGRYDLLRQAAKTYWPQAREAARWSAQDCMPLDGVPYIGQFSPSAPNWYVATGFQKWGMTSSMTAASILCGLITGREDPDGQVFAPHRFHLASSAKNLWTDGGKTVKSLARSAFAPPQAALDELPPGHGGIVDCDGVKAGVYKDEERKVYAVSVCCPHLGCQLEWNSDEKSWDCPCHGSRFDYTGALLDNPAQENLKGSS